MSLLSDLKTSAYSGAYCAKINIYGKKVNKLQKNGLRISRSEIQDPNVKNGMKTYKVCWEHAKTEIPRDSAEFEELPMAQQLWLISTAAKKKK